MKTLISLYYKMREFEGSPHLYGLAMVITWVIMFAMSVKLMFDESFNISYLQAFLAVLMSVVISLVVTGLFVVGYFIISSLVSALFRPYAEFTKKEKDRLQDIVGGLDPVHPAILKKISSINGRDMVAFEYYWIMRKQETFMHDLELEKNGGESAEFSEMKKSIGLAKTKGNDCE